VRCSETKSALAWTPSVNPAAGRGRTMSETWRSISIGPIGLYVLLLAALVLSLVTAAAGRTVWWVFSWPVSPASACTSRRNTSADSRSVFPPDWAWPLAGGFFLGLQPGLDRDLDPGRRRPAPRRSCRLVPALVLRPSHGDQRSSPPAAGAECARLFPRAVDLAAGGRCGLFAAASPMDRDGTSRNPICP